ncbi:hypothetical protein ABN072_01850 [Providencia rettgeri]|uniref:hypothetical protein n=1 Tax=Providencia rettgeri TaxID=587 RepID=UPI0032DB8D46
MKITGGLRNDQRKALVKALDQLEMPAKKRQRLLWRIAKLGVIAAAKRNQRNQTDPEGNAWPKRKRGKKKMLSGLVKVLHIREMPEIAAVRIYLKGGKYHSGGKPISAGLIGAVHQEGASITVNGGKIKNEQKDSNNKNDGGTVPSATKSQAKRLKRLGYKRWNGRRYVSVPVKVIEATMTYNQAGLLIRKLRGKPAKKTWHVEIPSRVFLGMSDDDFNKVLARQLQGINFGWNVKAQDIKGKQ